MNILYDHQIFTLQKVGGVSRYFYEIIKGLSGTNKTILPILVSNNLYLKQDTKIKSAKYFYDFKFKGEYRLLNLPNYHLTKYLIRKYLKKDSYDIFHPTWYDPYFWEYCKKPVIVTIHDLIHEKKIKLSKAEVLRQDYNTIKIKKESILRSAKIIAVSENTKNDIVNLYDIDPQKIEVIYHGYTKPPLKYMPNIWGNYILFVGRRKGYKNFYTFIRSISSLLNEKSDLKLICIGSEFGVEELEYLKANKINQKVIALQVNDSTLHSIYHYARAFIYPSLYEGFGMPILEAFSNGTPCCLSEIACFSEVAQTAAIYFDPLSVTSMSEAINKVLSDNVLRKNLINDGYKQLSNFSWQKSVIKTEQLYKAVIKDFRQ